MDLPYPLSKFDAELAERVLQAHVRKAYLAGFRDAAGAYSWGMGGDAPSEWLEWFRLTYGCDPLPDDVLEGIARDRVADPATGR